MKLFRTDLTTSIILLIVEFIAGFTYPKMFMVFGINLVLLIIQLLWNNKDSFNIHQKNDKSLSKNYIKELAEKTEDNKTKSPKSNNEIMKSTILVILIIIVTFIITSIIAYIIT